MRLFIASLLFCTVTVLHASESLPKITPAEVAAYRKAHEAEWLSHIKTGEPRLFYKAEDWSALNDRIRRAPAPLSTWYKDMLTAADRVMATPLPTYKTPEELADNDRNTLIVARQELWQREVGNELVLLAVAAKLSPSPEPYRKRMHDLVLTICRFNTWGISVRINGDLAAAHLMRGICMAYDWNRDLFNPEEKQFLIKTIRERIPNFLQGLYGGAFYGGEFQANHNHISIATMGLTGATFLEEIPEAADWLAGAMLDYERIGQAMNPDGSSIEGVGYWSYGLSFILSFIEGVKHVANTQPFYDAPYLRNAGHYRLGASSPDFQFTLMWGDATGKDYYGPQQLLYRLASQYKDGSIQYLADKLPYPPLSIRRQGGGYDFFPFLVLWYDPSVSITVPKEVDVLLPDWGVATTRSGWSSKDYLLSLKGGLNNTHHSHLDAGALSFYFDGQWMLRTPGYGSGGRLPGFWDSKDKRWTFFSNSTESHTALLLNGRNQNFDPKATGEIDGFASAPATAWISVDLRSVYADVSSARRQVFHRRGNYLLVLDSVSAEKPVTAEWLAQVPPEAAVTDRGLAIGAGGSLLKVRRIGGDGKFAKRAPTSPIVDASSMKVETYALKDAGSDVSFVVLLQPLLADDKTTSLEAVSERRGAVTEVRVKTAEWSDDLATRNPAGALTLGTGDNSASATAVLLHQRITGNTRSDLFATMAREVSSSWFTAKSAEPFSFETSTDATGGYRITLTTPFNGSIKPAAGLALHNAEKKPISLEKAVSLAAGTYLLLPVKTATR
ncbi:MAG: hypothetical protein B9S32_10895 [Verrucomicrobia bacterium Tous-C9LFEB]|nr:MAG: hypothetical protein B9S32_10895 [Verrucomicrobia bacterium Tous-C9LFEB]